MRRKVKLYNTMVLYDNILRIEIMGRKIITIRNPFFFFFLDDLFFSLIPSFYFSGKGEVWRTVTHHTPRFCVLV